MLSQFTDTNLAQLVRFLEENIEKRRNDLEKAVKGFDINRAILVQGSLDELRHIVAMAKSELRSRSKEAL
jgi:hypothetical protein